MPEIFGQIGSIDWEIEIEPRKFDPEVRTMMSFGQLRFEVLVQFHKLGLPYSQQKPLQLKSYMMIPLLM